jgi:hypothetical protein
MRTIVLALTLAAAAADDEKGPTADPKGTPLELSITGEKTAYPLGAVLSADELKKMAEAKQRLPKTPEVELKAVIKNTGERPVRLWTKGDPVVLTLELKGEGAVNLEQQLPMTLEFRTPEAVVVEPGKTVELPIKSLTSGFRGQTTVSYWTKPGEYELVATLKTGMQPAPEGAKDQDGFGLVKLTSSPLKVKVEEKK